MLSVQRPKAGFSAAAVHCRACKNVMTLAELGGSRKLSPGRGLQHPAAAASTSLPPFLPAYLFHTGWPCTLASPYHHGDRCRSHLQTLAEQHKAGSQVLLFGLSSWLGDLWKEREIFKCSL